MKSTFKVLFFLKRNYLITAGKVRNVFLGKKEKAKTLLQMFAQHNEQQYTTKCRS